MAEDYSEEFTKEFNSMLSTAKRSFKIMLGEMLKNTVVEKEYVNPKDYGYETEDEMLLKNWDLLDPEDKEHLKALGITPETENNAVKISSYMAEQKPSAS